jgi:quinol monooxygenase YgiN
MPDQPTPLTVLARIRALPGHEHEVKAALLALIPPTRRERGCLNYDLHQSTDDPTLFIFHENWHSRAHLDTHLEQPHLDAFEQQTQGLLAEPVEITFWEIINQEG